MKMKGSDISYCDNSFTKEEYINVNCPAHSHFDLEIIIVKSGELIVEKNNERYVLCKRNSILIMPFETHKFITEHHSNAIILTINPMFFPEYKSRLENKVPKKPVMTILEEDFDYVTKHCDLMGVDKPFEIRCVFYSLLCLFEKNSQFITTQTTPSELFEKVIMYICENFSENITLKQIAKELHVSYVHLSRQISKCTNVSFSSLLNNIRLEHSIRLLKNTSMPMSDIAYECGWNSIRNFNRLFMETFSCTPSQFRKNNR